MTTLTVSTKHYIEFWLRYTNNSKNNTLVSNHFHSVKNILFSSAKPRDFDGMLGSGLPVSMYTTKTPIDKWCFNVIQLQDFFFTFSVKDRYQLDYFICIKDFNAQTITSLKLNLFSFFIYCYQYNERKTACLEIVVCRTPVFSQPISWRFHITITYNLPHLRLWYVDVVTVVA